MTDLQAKLLVAFDAEYRSILETIRSTITAAESAGELQMGAGLNDAFRMAHTLKGSAHVVGLTKVVTLAHRLESVFARARESKLTLKAPELRLIHEALGAIEDLVAASGGQGTEPEVSAVMNALDAVLGAKTAPTLAVVPNAQPQPAPSLTPEVSVAEGESVRLSARHLDQLLDTSAELVGVIRGGRDVGHEVQRLNGHLDSILREWDLLRRGSGLLQALSHAPEFARVAQFIDFLGAQLGPMTKTARGLNRAARQSEWDLTNLAEQLQHDVRRARTVPAETVFGGFHKMVRDVAHALDRAVDFRFKGLEVAVDRGVLQALKDPLMHMLRNAIGHGLETGEERRRLGKDVNGKLTVSLAIVDGRLLITMTDDGRGLDEVKIRERAIAAGLLTAESARDLPSERIFDLIFRPGLSTAVEVTNLAGRGMGMSVVEESVKKLRGTIAITSKPNLGSSFTISVPVTLANHHLVLVRLADQTFALPSSGVESLKRVPSSEVRMVSGRRTILRAGEPIPLVDLGQLLDEPQDAPAENGLLTVAVLREEDRRLAVTVDAVLDQREALIKNLSVALQRLRLFAGAITQGDGSVTLVLSPNLLIGRGAGGANVTQTTRISLATTKRKTARILVVDDSITTRTLERGILEADGFEVGLAVDGVDALAKLSLDPYDLVISDVEMPRMDGFTLVGELKKSPKFKDIPVIMVTSLEKPADRERGLTLGANAYVLKQKFDQGGLLEIIRRIL